MLTEKHLQEFALHCPKECGGRLSEDIRFFLIEDQEVVIQGNCQCCGASGILVISLSHLLLNAPKALIN